jgi:hypothetical protein
VSSTLSARLFSVLVFILMLPLLSASQQDSASGGMKFDFGISKAKNIQLWPLLTVTNEPGFKRTEILSGLFDHQRHSIENSFVKTHLFPVYWFNNKKGKSLRVLSLYYPSLFHYEYTKRDSLQLTSVLELAPGLSFFSISSSPQGAYIENNLFFLLWYKNDLKRANSHFVLFPLIWKYKSPDKSSFTLFPLFTMGHRSTDRRFLGITPFFWHVSNFGTKRTILFPLFWLTKTGLGENLNRRTVLFPFYFGYKNKYYTNRVLFPFLFSFKNETYKSFTFFPFFSEGHSPDRSKTHFSATALYWHTKDTTGHSNVLFPFWWNGKHDSKNAFKHYNIVFPVYWSSDKKYTNRYSNAARTSIHDTLKSSARVYFPFVWKFTNKRYHSFTLFPFYSIGKSTDEKNSHISIGSLFWNFKHEHGSKSVLFPFWWSGKSQDKNSNGKYRVLFPLWWSFHSTYTDPSYIHNTFTTNSVFFPLIWKLKDEKRSSLTIFPFFSRRRSADGLDQHLFVTPFFGITTNNDLFHNTYNSYLFPFFNYENNAGSTKLNVLLFLYRTEHSPYRKSTSVIWPLCEYAEDSIAGTANRTGFKKRSFHLFPFIWYAKSPDSYMISILPVYSYRRDSSSVTKHILWPLYRSKNVFGISHTSSILWQVFRFERDNNGDGGVRIFYRIFSNIHKDGDTEKSIFPFVYKTTKKDGGFYRSYFLSFYNYRKHKIENTNYYYQEERIFWLLRLRSNFKSLKDKGVVTKRKGLR